MVACQAFALDPRRTRRAGYPETLAGKSRKSHARVGITRTELLAAALILVLLGALAAPWILSRRTESRRLGCEARLIELARAMNAHSELDGAYPGYAVDQLNGQESGKAIGWAFPLLPLVAPPASASSDWGPLQQIHDAYGPAGPPGTAGETPHIRLALLICPAHAAEREADDEPLLSYVANTGMPDVEATAEAPADWPANGVLQRAYPPSPFALTRVSHAYVQQHDGTDNTLLLSENVDAGRWTDADEPRVGFVWIDHVVDDQPARGELLLGINEQVGQGDGSYQFARPSSRHPAGVNITYCSARSQFLSQNIDWLVFTQLLTSNAPEVKRPGTHEPVAEPYRIQ